MRRRHEALKTWLAIASAVAAGMLVAKAAWFGVGARLGDPVTRPGFGCGETSERTAARAHQIITVFYTVAAIGLGGALATVATMIAWHRASAEIHTGRAIERGEM